jgi:uncharacterized protein YecE (DUF72 family)
MRVLAGTSGYAYKEWKGSFYPDDLKNDGMLTYYAQHFHTVEINNTFYRLPSKTVLQQWADQVPDDFAFVLKASQRITHHKRLKNADEPLGYLLENAKVLGSRRGPILFQLPPNMKRDLERLHDFLELLPEGTEAAFEFRHVSWFDKDVYAALRRRHAALCVADTDDGTPAMEATAPFGYLRMRREQYDDAELRSWAEWVQEQAWDRAFVFFKHEDEGAGPALAKRFLSLTASGPAS